MKEKRANLDMTQGNPTKLLVLFAIPMWIGGVFQLLYNMVDTIVVGRFVSLDALAAIGATTSTTMFLMMMGNGLTNAISVIISQAEGAKQDEGMKRSVTHAAYLTLAVGVILGAAAFFGARPLMKLLQAPPEILDQSVLYIQIVGGLMIGQTAYNGATSILRAIGDSRTPLYFLIFSSLLNVVLDLAFVLGLHAGVAGVAWATVISQIVSAVLCVGYMLKKYPKLCPDKEAWRLDTALLKDYLRIGLPMCVQSAVLSIGDMIITAVINSHGADIVAAYTIGSKVQNLATITFSNIAFSFSVYSGQNFGAKKYDRIKDGLKKGLTLICGLALVSAVVVIVFAKQLALIFMDSDAASQVLNAAISMIRIQGALFFALGAIWALNSALRGMGLISITLVSSAVELVSKIGFSLLLPLFMDFIGIWVAAPIGWVLGIIPSAILLSRWFKDPEKYARKTATEDKAM